MTAEQLRTDFIVRIIIATVLMGAALWYLDSLWDARMREQNLILIRPVVLVMIPFYFATIFFEVRRYRAELKKVVPAVTPAAGRQRDEASTSGNQSLNQAIFMAVAAASVAGFYILGAIPATILLIVSGLLVLGERRPVVIAITASVTTFVLWFVFIQLFGIRMPLFPWN